MYLDDLVLRTRDGERTWFLTDAQSSIVRALDDDGMTLRSFRYDDFGKPWVDEGGLGSFAELDASTPDADQLFTGAWHDADTGLYWLRTRLLDPDLGRFVSRDPAGIWADSAALGNGFTYAANSPATFVDPLGLFALDLDRRPYGGVIDPVTNEIDGGAHQGPATPRATSVDEAVVSPTAEDGVDLGWIADLFGTKKLGDDTRALAVEGFAEIEPTGDETADETITGVFGSRNLRARDSVGDLSELGAEGGYIAMTLLTSKGAGGGAKQGVTEAAEEVATKSPGALRRAAASVGEILQGAWRKLRGSPRTASAAPSAERILSNQVAGDIIQWPTGQGSAQLTAEMARDLTAEQVASMQAKGLNLATVEALRSQYGRALEAGGRKLSNEQLVPRTQLMDRIIELWPK
jgi:RHS repeat-associated protein